MIYNQRDKVAYFHVWNTFYSNIESSDEIVFNTLQRLDVKKLIIDCSTENGLLDGIVTDTTKELNSYVKANNIEAILILGAFPSEYTKKNWSNFEIVIYPLFWLDETYKTLKNIDNSFINFNPKVKTSLFFSHNYKPRPHRCLLIDHLVKHNLLEHGGFTWNMLTNDKGSFSYWKEELVKDNNDGAYHTDPLDQFQSPGSGYINSLFDLVSETTVDEIFWTEKTWKPILYGKPFIIWGAKGINKKLKEYGFHLFEDVVNYNFDDIENTEERIEALCLELKRLSKLDYKNINFQKMVEANKSQAQAILNPYSNTHGDILNFLQSHKIDPSEELHINLEEQYIEN